MTADSAHVVFNRCIKSATYAGSWVTPWQVNGRQNLPCKGAGAQQCMEKHEARTSLARGERGSR